MSADKARARKPAPETARAPHAAAAEPGHAHAAAGHAAKFRSFDVKLSVLMTGAQADALDRVVKEIMRHRSEKRERITKNTLMRCLIDLLEHLTFAMANIPDEDELRRRLIAAAKRGPETR